MDVFGRLDEEFGPGIQDRHKFFLRDALVQPVAHSRFGIRIRLMQGREGLSAMFARRIRVEYDEGGERRPCPIKWLDNFAMRNFTNDPIFDDTLPVEDGVLEAGVRVPLDRLKDAMEDWFRRKSYIGKAAGIWVEEQGH
jgi:hypothetical protein